MSWHADHVNDRFFIVYKFPLTSRTALHWACKRGHVSIVQILLQNGADISIKNFKGELASDLTTLREILAVLKIEPDEDFARRCAEGTSKLPIVPNYLKSPLFPYSTQDNVDDSVLLSSPSSMSATCNSHLSSANDRVEHKPTEGTSHKGASGGGKNLTSESTTSATSPFVFRVRVSGSNDSDFVEVEVPSLSYSSLLKACCEELEVGHHEITKIRKLPNVWVRKDRDVQRLKEGQELEIILSTE